MKTLLSLLAVLLLAGLAWGYGGNFVIHMPDGAGGVTNTDIYIETLSPSNSTTTIDGVLYTRDEEGVYRAAPPNASSYSFTNYGAVTHEEWQPWAIPPIKTTTGTFERDD